MHIISSYLSLPPPPLSLTYLSRPPSSPTFAVHQSGQTNERPKFWSSSLVLFPLWWWWLLSIFLALILDISVTRWMHSQIWHFSMIRTVFFFVFNPLVVSFPHWSGLNKGTWVKSWLNLVVGFGKKWARMHCTHELCEFGSFSTELEIKWCYSFFHLRGKEFLSCFSSARSIENTWSSGSTKSARSKEATIFQTKT